MTVGIEGAGIDTGTGELIPETIAPTVTPFDSAETESSVNGLISQMVTSADDIVALADDLMGRIGTIDTGQLSSGGGVLYTADAMPGYPTTTQRVFEDIDVALPEAPAPVQNFPFPQVILPAAEPVMGMDPPNIYIPDSPDVNWPIFSKEAPTVGEVVLPGKPVYSLPPVPKLDAIVMPAAPAYNEIDFSAVMPVMDLTAPIPNFAFSETLYTSEVLSEMMRKLREWIADTSSTGISDEVQSGILDRARTRQQVRAEGAMADAENFFSSRGFLLPARAISSGIEEATVRAAAVTQDLENDIVIQLAKLAQVHMNFAIEQSLSAESLMAGIVDAYQTRALEAAKAVVDYAVAVYKYGVDGYKARLAGFEVMAQVFDARIRGEIAKAEFFKAEIEAAKLTGEAQKALVRAYVAQIGGIEAMVSLYKAEVDGGKIQVAVDEARLQGFGAEVDAFTEQVKAISARYDGYRAQIAGESEKATVYATEVDAFQSEVSAYSSKADVEIANAKLTAEHNRLLIAALRMNVENFSAAVSQNLGIASAEIKELMARSDYSGHVARKAGIDANANTQEKLSSEDVFRARMQEIAAEASTTAARTAAMTGRAGALSSAASNAVYQLTAAKISANNTSINKSFSSRKSQEKSYSSSNQKSNSIRFSTSDNVNYVTSVTE